MDTSRKKKKERHDIWAPLCRPEYNSLCVLASLVKMFLVLLLNLDLGYFFAKISFHLVLWMARRYFWKFQSPNRSISICINYSDLDGHTHVFPTCKHAKLPRLRHHLAFPLQQQLCGYVTQQVPDYIHNRRSVGQSFRARQRVTPLT